ncbi:MAG: hypothetical protein HY885_01450 [Deltaproteobacteria bacterium]|nr:hypothetical protein [Deltaproteobacteria bacterium]
MWKKRWRNLSDKGGVHPMIPHPLFADIGVGDLASATVARRVAGEMASVLGFSRNRRAEAVLIASELAHNHVMHHTVQGRIRISGFFVSAIPCLAIASLDQGPGLHPETEAFKRKHFAEGGLGAGLGTVLRLSDRLDIFSRAAGKNGSCPYATIISALLGPDREISRQINRIGGSLAVLLQPRSDSGWCGDGFSAWQDERYLRLTLVDSLGLGKGAAEISRLVFEELNKHPLLWPPAQLLEELEFALAGTHGAAVHVLLFDQVKKILSSAGVGNISTLLDVDGRQIREGDPPGIVGHGKWRKIAGQDYGVRSGVRVLMHTDGQNRIADLTAGLTLSPPVAAQILFDPVTPQRDDATLVTWQWPEKSTNPCIS